MLLSSQKGWSQDTHGAIDTHAHVFLKSLPMVSDRRYTPEYDADLNQYLSVLAQAECSRGVLTQPSFLGTDNSFLLAALARYPDQLRGIVVVEPAIDATTLDALNLRGVVGIRLNLIGEPDPALNSPPWRRHLDHLARLGWQVEIQAEAARLEHFIPSLLSAGVRVVVDHFGRPDEALGVRDRGFLNLLKRGDNGKVYVKLSGAYRLGDGQRGNEIALEASRLLLKAFGPHHLVWGTDWPHTEFETTAPSPAELPEGLAQWVPNESERRIILSDTPAALFKFQSLQMKKKAL